jgi:hypothetical protein
LPFSPYYQSEFTHKYNTSYFISQKQIKEGSGNRASLFLWDSERGTWRGGSFTGDFERYVKEALEMEYLSLCRGSVRGTWTYHRRLWKGSISLYIDAL